jgi:membrane protease YdiL (CAAX protease family)
MPWDFWLIFLVLGVLIPWRGTARLKHLLSQTASGTKEKLVLYASTIAFQCTLLGLVAWRALARGLTASELGLARRVGVGILLASFIGAAVLCAFQWFNLRRLGRTSGAVVDLMRKLAERLLPAQGKLVEFLPYCALAVTAGVCEEFLYRGFSMAALGRVGIPAWAIVLLTSALFGLAHAYQGRGGIVGTALLGVLFAISRLIFNSLVPAIVWHAAVDVTAGLAGPRFLLNGKQEAASEAAA